MRILLRWLLRLIFVVVASILVVVGVTAGSIIYLRDSPPPTSAFMIRARSADPATGLACDEVEYQWVDGDRIAPALRLAVVVAEDQRFMLHDGFDRKQIRKAIEERVETGRVRGASTISQQLAKNLFFWPGGGYFRKALEAWMTLWIERLWSKQRILEVYLNVVQFGPCTFGAEAASQRYFEHSAAELQPTEAALLATVLPNPARLRAWNPGPYAQQRRDEVFHLMVELGTHPHLRGL